MTQSNGDYQERVVVKGGTMKITAVKLLTLQQEEQPVSLPALLPVPGLRRSQYRSKGAE